MASVKLYEAFWDQMKLKQHTELEQIPFHVYE